MFKNMKINKRLILAFVVAVLVSSVAGIVGIVLLNLTDTSYSDALVTYGFAQGDVGNLGRHFQKQRAATLYLLTNTDPASATTYAADLVDIDKTIAADLLQVNKGLGSELGQQTYAKLTTAWDTYRVERDEVIAATASSRGESAVLLLKEKCGVSSAAVSEIIDTMLSDKSRIGTEKSTQLTIQTQIFSWLMIAVMIVAMILACALAIYTARGISKPIAQVERAAKEMAKGNFEVQVDFTSRDEIGSLAESMRQMIKTTKDIIMDTARGLGEMAQGNFDVAPQVDYIGVFRGIEEAMVNITNSLSSTLSQIHQSSTQVSAGSEQVSSGAQALSQGATQQASSVEELSATIAEISTQVKLNAQSAAQASGTANQTGAEIDRSNQRMTELMKAIEDISHKSSEIGKIIKTIDDIAFQTNILALNAAVEAARAGAAGKGFAVVADEVRNLSGKSAQAAKNTTALIEDSIHAVEIGSKLAQETAAAMAGVVTMAQEVVSAIDRISSASSEQASSITQVTLGMDQISAVVQTNSATAEESAAASEELSGQAQMLKTLVGKFRIKDVDGSAGMRDHLKDDFDFGPTPSSIDNSFANVGSGKY